MRSRIVDSELLEGPNVHTIFALRDAAATIGSKPLGLLINFYSCFYWLRSSIFGIKLGIEFRAQQDDDRKNVEPYQQRYGCAQ